MNVPVSADREEWGGARSAHRGSTHDEAGQDDDARARRRRAQREEGANK